MCLALYKPANIKPDWTALEEGMCHNSDGAGFAVAVDGQLIVEKGFFKFADFKKAFEPFGDHAAIVHFRLATHGGKNQQNCHPFALADFGNEADHMPVAVIHNGIFSQAANDQKQWSDTWHICRDVLHPLWSKDEKSLVSSAVIPLGDSFVGSSNKLVFLYADGTVGIWGEKNGHWSEGVWYSNYSYCSYGARYADPRNKYAYGYDDDDSYWNDTKYAAGKKSPAFEPLIDYAVEATAVELALIEELRDLGYAEDEIERLYIRRGMAEEVASVYQLTVSDVMTCARQRAENDGFEDPEIDEDDIPDLTSLPDDYTYVGKGALTKTASKLDGSVLGWDSASHKWVKTVGILSNIPYAVRNDSSKNKSKQRVSRKLPEGFVFLGKGPVHSTGGPLNKNDIMRWSDGYGLWTPCSGLLGHAVYCARKGCSAYVTNNGRTVSAFSLEPGKRYVTREGVVTSPMELIDSKTEFKYSAKLGDNLVASTFTKLGKFATTPTRNDLVAEYVPRMQISVGVRYITRSGLITMPMELNGGSTAYPFRAMLTSDGEKIAAAVPLTVLADGRFLKSPDHKPHDNDIVAVYDPAYEILTGDRRVGTGDEVLTSVGEWVRVNAAPSARMTAGKAVYRRKKPVEAGEGYRLLTGDDVLQAGDEYLLNNGKWVPTAMAGTAVGHVDRHTTYRRKTEVESKFELVAQ